jgi:ketosteroid isomerase-like protein
MGQSKKGALIAATLIAVGLAGCPAPRSPSEAQRRAEAWIAALNSHNVDVVVQLFDPGGTYEDPTTASISGGALRDFWSRVYRTWPQLTFTAATAVAEDNRVALEWQSRGVHVTGRTLTTDGTTVIEWAGNRVRHARVYYDSRVYQRLFGPP